MRNMPACETWGRRLALICFCLLLGCSGNTLDRDTALKELNSKFRAKRRDLMFNIGRVGSHCSTVDLGEGKRGEIDLDPGKKIATIVAMKGGYVTVVPDGKDYWKVDLTARGKSFMDAQRKHPYGNEKQKGCDFEQVEFPIAEGSVLEVTGITEGEALRGVDFQWKWQPTELGVRLREDGDIYSMLTPAQREDLAYMLNVGETGVRLPVPLPPADSSIRSTVRFKKYDDGWRIQ
jgi:hypothetical protein